jgi:hypothetical protein
MQPDWVWIKQRSGTAQSHYLVDAVRGNTQQLASNLTDAESTANNALTSFNSNGFTVGTNTDGYNVNANTQTYIGWQWRASNATAVTNTAGTITSTVSANTTAGFSIATLTTQASGTGTFGHGLGVAPSMVICKYTSTTSNWFTWHTSIAGTDYLTLNTTSATTNNSAIFSAAPTSTVVNLGTAWGGSGQIVAYCFAPVAGYSAFGSFTGNGSADGPFVYLGFRPKFFLYKKSNSTSDWWMFDATRNTSNVVSAYLFADLGNAEGTENWFDFTANGLKIRDRTDVNTYGSGGTYIYMAFSETPQKFALGRC